MNKKQAPANPDAGIPRLLNEDEIASLIAQFRYMLVHEVKNMKLEVIETMGAMLARRSGIDKEIHDLTARVEVLAKSVEGFGIRLTIHEKGEPPAQTRLGPRGSSRNLTAEPAPSAIRPAPAAPPIPIEDRPVRLKKDGSPDRRGRVPGKGRYEAYNAAKRTKKSGGMP